MIGVRPTGSGLLTRRQLLVSGGIGSASILLFLDGEAAAVAGGIRIDECQSIAFFTEPRTGTTSFYVADDVARTLTPDSAVFRAHSGAISFVDATGIAYRTQASEIRMAAGFSVINGTGFDLSDPHEVARESGVLSRLVRRDPELLANTTRIGAGAVIGYFRIVSETGLAPGGGLAIGDLAIAAQIATDSLDRLDAVPAGEEVNAAFLKAFADWNASVVSKSAETQKKILDAYNACVDAAANAFDLDKCKAKYQARQKCLENAVNQCMGLCKSIAEARDPATTARADKACSELFKACTTGI